MVLDQAATAFPQRILVDSSHKRVLVLYGSTSGTAQTISEDFETMFAKLGVDCDVLALDEIDPEDLCNETLVLIVLSTYSGGEPPANASFFCNWVSEAQHDFRVGTSFLSTVDIAMLGIGSSVYEEHFNTAADGLHKAVKGLGARTLGRMGVIDVETESASAAAAKWFDSILPSLRMVLERKGRLEVDGVMDLEDLGGATLASEVVEIDGEVPEMLTETMKKGLTKQGYKLIGTHSAVKLCRWTKAMLRGRGGCYKHTFYGITSYQCMETTPNLSCANKCVFCWRHHTNPVAKEWKWKADAPELILEGAIEKHKKLINMMRGVPGVQPERLIEAFNIQHCALSLVGEPIMYPYINEFCNMLHERKISSFLVTNAQFPQAIIDMVPITQLYVSIDASNKEALKKIDRPLNKDFWERFIASLEAIALKPYRTVFRMTLVKGYNMDELKEYAKLILMSKPTLIEVKGVTFCGDSDTSDMTMKNVPWHVEVRQFCEALCEEIGGGEYELACEHAHSCCVLIGNKKLKVDNVWHTWIDYPRFHELVASGESFTVEDYMAPTPDWAVYGNEHAGFDPEETRHYRKKKVKAVVQEE